MLVVFVFQKTLQRYNYFCYVVLFFAKKVTFYYFFLIKANKFIFIQLFAVKLRVILCSAPLFTTCTYSV